MSRVERTENAPERRGSEPSWQAGRGRNSAGARNDPNPGQTPSKAEGAVVDVEEAIEHQSE